MPISDRMRKFVEDAGYDPDVSSKIPRGSPEAKTHLAKMNADQFAGRTIRTVIMGLCFTMGVPADAAAVLADVYSEEHTDGIREILLEWLAAHDLDITDLTTP